MTWVRRLGLATGLALALTGCADQAPFDPSVVESYLQTSQAVVFPEEDVGAAACPDQVPLREGVRIDCTLQVAGQEVPYEVRLTNVAGDRVTIEAEPRGTLIPLDGAEQYVLESLPPDTDGATVTCGEGAVAVVQPGATITCTVALGSETEPVVLEVLDEAGTVRIAD